MGTSEFNAVGVALGCTSIPSSGEWNTPTCFTGISSGLKSHLESMQNLSKKLPKVNLILCFFLRLIPGARGEFAMKSVLLDQRKEREQ